MEEDVALESGDSGGKEKCAEERSLQPFMVRPSQSLKYV